MPPPEEDDARRRQRPEPTDRQLLTAWAIRAVVGCALFGGVSVAVSDQPFTLRNVIAYGLLFGVLVVTLHYFTALYARRKARRR